MLLLPAENNFADLREAADKLLNSIKDEDGEIKSVP
jgi:hypothetical protein